MNSPIIQKQEFDETYHQYGQTLLHFIRQFTMNEATARKILDEAIWQILSRARQPSVYIGQFSRMLQITRQVTLNFLKSDPFFDPWASWEQEPDFFPFMEPRFHPLHKELFYRHYYRGISETELAEKLNLSLADVHLGLREALRFLRQKVFILSGS